MLSCVRVAYLIHMSAQALDAAQGVDPGKLKQQDKDQLLLQTALVTDCMSMIKEKDAATSFLLHMAVIRFILKNVDQIPLLSPDLKLLKATEGVANVGLVLGLNDSGEAGFKAQILEIKKAAFVGFFSDLLEPETATLRKSLFRNEVLYSNQDQSSFPGVVKLSAGLTKLLNSDSGPSDRRTLTKETIDGLKRLDLSLDVLNGILDRLLKLESYVRTKVESIDDSPKLAAFLNDSAYPSSHRKLLMKMLLASVGKSACRNKAAARKHATLVPELLTTLKYNKKPIPEKVAPGTQAFSGWMNEIMDGFAALLDTTAFTGANFKGVEAFVPKARDEYLQWYRDNSGMSALKRARDLAYDDNFVTGRIADALPGLMAAMQNLLDILVVKVSWQGNLSFNIPDLSALKPFVFYEFSEYQRALNTRKGGRTMSVDSDYTCQTSFSSLNLPLYQIKGRVIYFYNSVNNLFLVDTKEPDWLKRFEAGGLTAKLSLTQLDDVNRSFAKGWRSSFGFNFAANYAPMYRYTKGQEIGSELFWQKNTGFGGGMSRVDLVVPADYRWSFGITPEGLALFRKQFGLTEQQLPTDTYAKLLAAYLGLSLESYIQKADVMKKTEWMMAHNATGFRYEYMDLELTLPSGQQRTERFVLCGTPYSRPFPDGSAVPVMNILLQAFTIWYYRKADFWDEDTWKVLKSPDDIRNRPLPDDVGGIYRDIDEETGALVAYGVNLPISFNDPKNLARLKELKKTWGVIKNKGNPLGKNFFVRNDAGRVMSALVAFSGGKLSGSSVSAGTLASMALKSPDTLKQWRDLKATEAGALPTDQEWCHLMGHGDGGNERVGNFVSGSKHCNTEQLAIETGQRRVTHLNPGGFLLKATAYLIPDQSMDCLNNDLKQCYLVQGDSTYLHMAYVYNKQAKNVSEDQTKSDVADDLKKTVRNAPVAAFIRYKVSVKDGPGRFDYAFEGQGEFFDQNQFNILSTSIRFLMDPKTLLDDMKSTMANLTI